jgi:hypothetical protein
MSQLGVVDSVLVANGLIVAVGDRTSVEASLDGPTLTIDLKQNCVLPGFIDAHSHPVFNAELDVALDLSGALSISDMVEIFATAASTTPAGKWIHGMSLDLENFDRLPTRWDLDEATSTHPVVAYINGGHFVLANTKTLNERGVNEATPSPRGGHLVRDDRGRITGLFLDAATSLVVPSVDVGCHGPNLHYQSDAGAVTENLIGLYQKFLTTGVTTIVDAQVSSRELGVYQRASSLGGLSIRTVCLALSHQIDELVSLGIRAGFGSDRLAFRGVKFYVDGTINGGTIKDSDADFMRSQTREHGFPPTLFWDQESLIRAVSTTYENGLAVALHCHGDIAIGMALDAVGAARDIVPDGPRPRLEHCSFPSSTQLSRMADLGVICVSQPLMVHNYGDWLLDQYGDFARDVMPLRREIEAGITVALSADNVLPLDPLKVIQRAAERTCKSGRPIGPEQALTIEEGLRAYTADSALTIGLENELGTIEPGKLADLVILEKDPVMQPISEVGSIETVMTIVGGEIVWESAKSKVSKLLPSG